MTLPSSPGRALRHRRTRPITPEMTVLFRAAAGPRLGFGHLVRCRSLARALGVPAQVSMRARPASIRQAARLGWQVVSSRLEVLATLRPTVLVVDDPSAAAATPWVRRARRLGIVVVSMHDLGLAPVPSQLSVDGSVVRTTACGARALRGPRFAVLDPAIAAQRAVSARPEPRRVLIALGGGVRGSGMAARLVRHLLTVQPALDIRVAAGFVTRTSPEVVRERLVSAPDGLAGELAAAAVAIVAGGLTVYEACALGVAVVATPVTPAQAPTVRAMAAHGAAVAAPPLRSARDAARVAALALRVLDDDTARRTQTRRARHLIDGRGAWRVAGAIRALVGRAASRHQRPHHGARRYADAA